MQASDWKNTDMAAFILASSKRRSKVKRLLQTRAKLLAESRASDGKGKSAVANSTYMTKPPSLSATHSMLLHTIGMLGAPDDGDFKKAMDMVEMCSHLLKSVQMHSM